MSEREAHRGIYGWWNLPLDGSADDTDDADDDAVDDGDTQ